MLSVSVGVVIPVGAGREENLRQVLQCLASQTMLPDAVVLVEDGEALPDGFELPRQLYGRFLQVRRPKHQPGQEQPRNVGVRVLRKNFPLLTHIWFLDSDIVVERDCLEQLVRALLQGPDQRILVAPYDWMRKGSQVQLDNLDAFYDLRNDPRWPAFQRYTPDEALTGDLAAGLACFSGNLMWPIYEFERVGGFWSEIHHGRCEDGELGLRAVAMGVPISFAAEARGWHLWHPVNAALAVSRNSRDVPMLNDRHPWLHGSDVFVVERDGKAFDVTCQGCGGQIPTIEWWRHAELCDVTQALPMRG